MGEQMMFRERAHLYDLLYSFKDYAAEAAILRQLLAAEGVPDGARLLETACGTASFAVELREWYDVLGLDVNEGMLAVAREKLPDVPLIQADMTDFTLDAPVDAIVCMFSSIGYLIPIARVADAAASFFANLRPGGVALVEPWLTPEIALPGHLSQTIYGDDDVKLCRAALHVIEDGVSVFDFHWLVTTRNGVEHFVDRHELGIYTSEEQLGAFRAAGFEARRIDAGLPCKRGLIVARKPR